MSGGFRKPRPIQPGMTIGVVMPSGPVREDAFNRGISRLEQAGFHVTLGAHARDARGYLAGNDRDRAADMTEMFARRDVGAVLCGRGGYGATRTIDLIDWEVVAANPKLFVGYSDITALHIALERRARLITLYGPVATTLGAGLRGAAEIAFWHLLTRSEPIGRMDTGSAQMATIAPGNCTGRLAGGCLSILAAAAGTPDAPDFHDRIVLIEDVGEPVYRADRYLTQLLRAGLLQDAAGFVVGRLTGWEKEEEARQSAAEITPDMLWADRLGPLGKPILAGFPFGHERNPLTLPLGCRASLDADAQTVTILESACA